MRQIQIRARSDRDADCLERELARYSPSRERRGITIDLTNGTEIALLGLLAAVETCLEANDIPSVSVKLDGQTYLLAASG